MKMQQLSMASDRLMGQPMFQILTKIKEMEREGKDVIHFEIGDPDFDTPDCVIQGAKRALDEGWTHYSSPAGDYELRQAICSSRFFTPRFTPDLDQVVVAPGANPLPCRTGRRGYHSRSKFLYIPVSFKLCRSQCSTRGIA